MQTLKLRGIHDYTGVVPTDVIYPELLCRAQLVFSTNFG